MRKLEEERRRIQEAIPVDVALERSALSQCEYFGEQPDDAVLTDISTFVNIERIVTSEPIDTYLLFDLDLFVDLIVLHEKVCVLQPFDERYPDMADFEWLEESNIPKALYKSGILVFRPVSGYDVPSWHFTKELLEGGKLHEAFRPFLAASESDGGTREQLESQTWGMGRHIHYYNEFYTKLYSPWIYEPTRENESIPELVRKYWKQFALLVYRTNECLAYVRKHKLPYHPSSLKVPIVKTMFKQNKIRIRTLIDSLVRQVEMRESIKASRLNEMIGDDHYEIETPSLLAQALEKAQSRRNILDATLELRNSAAKFRRRISRITSKKRGEAYEELRKIKSFGLAQSKASQSLLLEAVSEEIAQAIVLLEDPIYGLAIPPLIDKAAKVIMEHLRLHLLNRSLLFMRKFSKDSAAPNEIRSLVAKFFGKEISNQELARFWKMRNALVED